MCRISECLKSEEKTIRSWLHFFFTCSVLLRPSPSPLVRVTNKQQAQMKTSPNVSKLQVSGSFDCSISLSLNCIYPHFPAACCPLAAAEGAHKRAVPLTPYGPSRVLTRGRAQPVLMFLYRSICLYPLEPNRLYKSGASWSVTGGPRRPRCRISRFVETRESLFFPSLSRSPNRSLIGVRTRVRAGLPVPLLRKHGGLPSMQKSLLL